jgi:hypothetical protein
MVVFELGTSIPMRCMALIVSVSTVAQSRLAAITEAAPTAEQSSGDTRLAVLLAMAMFVLVVDTSLMNVSISAVVRDLDATASGVQSAIATEALVSAAAVH